MYESHGPLQRVMLLVPVALDSVIRVGQSCLGSGGCVLAFRVLARHVTPGIRSHVAFSALSDVVAATLFYTLRCLICTTVTLHQRS
jgi:hypothetical protein